MSFVFGWGLPSPVSNHTKTKNGCGPGLGELPKISRFPFNIFVATAELETLNLVHSLGLPKPIIKSHPEEKVGAGWG